MNSKIILLGMLVLSVIKLQAATVTYDFNSGLAGSTGGSLTPGALSFTHGSNSDANDSRSAERAWYDGDASGDDVFFISARSSDNKGFDAADLDMTAGAPSYASFTLTPAAGQNLDFSSSTLSLNAALLNDNTSTFNIGYQIWADIGSGWTALGSIQVVDGLGSGTGSGAIFEVDESTVLTLGNAMDSGIIAEAAASLNFDISTLGILSMDQPVVFAVALSGDRDNHFGFGSDLDDIVVSLAEGSSGNTQPVATNDVYGVLEEGMLTVSAPGVLANDGDVNGDPLSAQWVSDPANGSLSLNTNGSFTYTPNSNFSGTDSFTYAAHDGSSASIAATVSITVTNSPDAPVAVADSYAVVADHVLSVAAPGVLGNDSDADGDAISAIKVSDPANGSLVLNADGSFSYTPNSGFTGVDGFEYKVNDGSVDGNTVSVLISVNHSVAGIKPNILIFFADDMGYGDTQAYNPNCPVNMPRIEQLAQQGMRFTDAHTPAALCAPNRYSLLSGNYVWRNSGNSGWHFNRGSQFDVGQESVGAMLKKAGYHTAIMGKMHIGSLVQPLGGGTNYDERDPSFNPSKGQTIDDAFDPAGADWSVPLVDGISTKGFDYSFTSYGGIQDTPYMFFENDLVYGNTNDFMTWYGGSYPDANGTSIIQAWECGMGLPTWKTHEVGPMLVQKTIDFIDRHHQTNLVNGTSTPFLINYFAQAVHVPHTPPTNFLGTVVGGSTQVPSSKGGYSQHSDMLYELDVAFGMIQDALAERGLLDNTLIIFTSDNGGLKDSLTGTSFSNQPLNGYKSTAAEGGHRIPLIVKWGDGTTEGSHIPPAAVANQMVNVMDIYTTLAEIVGVEVPANQAFDSISMREIWLEGRTSEIRPTMLGFGGGSYYMRDGEWKYTVEGDYAGLYHLGDDLGETTDLSSDPANADRIVAMQAELDAVLAMDGTTNRSTVAPQPVPDPAVQTDLDSDGMEDGWERAYFASTNGYNGGALDDIDRDGLENLMEYALGGHPTAGVDGDSILPTYGISGSDAEFVFNRRTNAATLGLVYELEHTDNLISNVWSTGGYLEVGTGGLGTGLEAVTNLFITAGKTNEFIRLRVVAP